MADLPALAAPLARSLLDPGDRMRSREKTGAVLVGKTTRTRRGEQVAAAGAKTTLTAILNRGSGGLVEWTGAVKCLSGSG